MAKQLRKKSYGKCIIIKKYISLVSLLYRAQKHSSVSITITIFK
jgi:hypothetical protein